MAFNPNLAITRVFISMNEVYLNVIWKLIWIKILIADQLANEYLFSLPILLTVHQRWRTPEAVTA